MKIHEYQAKELLGKCDVCVTDGRAAFNVEESIEAAKAIGGQHWVVKAQIHSGGRGKAGGVKFASGLSELKSVSQELFGKKLVTIQTGTEGKVVQRIYIQKPVDIIKEFYLAVILDRASEMPLIIFSTEGGMEIEEVAKRTPEKILKTCIDPLTGLRSYHILKLKRDMELSKKASKSFSRIVNALYYAFMILDASMIEVNPLVLQPDDEFIALDAKVSLDDNAMFRHKEYLDLVDPLEEDAGELEASEYGLNYIRLNGNVGCMVNGAGLAMSTMDIIKQSGGEPANFLDVGGSASAETVAKGFEIILRDSNVRSVFVNIFGGIVRCDRIAAGILEAIEKVNLQLPVVVRLDGTNSEEALEMLKHAKKAKLITARGLAEGAKFAVLAAKGEM